MPEDPAGPGAGQGPDPDVAGRDSCDTASNDPETTARLLRRRLASAALDLPVSGESMGSTIRSGSVVHIPGPGEPRCGEIWAFAGSTGIVVHRVRHLTADSMTGRGDGNPLDDRTVPRSHLIGRVASSVGPDGSVRTFGAFDRYWAALRLLLRGRARRVVRSVSRRSR